MIPVDAGAQRILVWGALLLALLFAAAYILLLGFLPPPSPNLPAQQVARIYADHNIRFRIGVLLCIVSSGFELLWGVALAVQMARLEKGFPIWAVIQFAAATLGVLLFSIPAILWGAAAFSPLRNPAITLALHELAFLFFVTPVGYFWMQVLPVAIIALSRASSADPLTAFPRWTGYLSLWTVAVTEMGVAAMLFRSGPFAWNGLFPFWLPAITYVIWMAAIGNRMLHAISAQERAMAGGSA